MEIIQKADGFPRDCDRLRVQCLADALNSLVQPAEGELAEILDIHDQGFLLRIAGSEPCLCGNGAQACAYLLGGAWGYGESGAFGGMDATCNGGGSWDVRECSDSCAAYDKGHCYATLSTELQATAWATGAMHGGS